MEPVPQSSLAGLQLTSTAAKGREGAWAAEAAPAKPGAQEGPVT